MRSESVTTPKSALVDNTDYWHSTDTESAEIEVTELVRGFIRALQPEAVLETGTAFGQTTVAISQALAENGHGHLHSLDFTPERVQSVRNLLGNLGLTAWATVHQANAADWVPPEGTVFGFVWLDSDLQTRYQEFVHYLQWMKPGTIVGFHDMGPQFVQWGGGADKVQRLVDEGYIHGIFLPTPRGVCFGEVL